MKIGHSSRVSKPELQILVSVAQLTNSEVQSLRPTLTQPRKADWRLVSTQISQLCLGSFNSKTSSQSLETHPNQNNQQRSASFRVLNSADSQHSQTRIVLSIFNPQYSICQIVVSVTLKSAQFWPASIRRIN